MMRGANRSIAAALFCAILGGAAWVPGAIAAQGVFGSEISYGGPPAGFPGVGAPAGFGAAAGIVLAAAQDTMETFDVELEEEGEGMSIYAEIAIVAVVAGIAGYAVYELIKADEPEESTDDGGSGKPTPFAAPVRLRLPFSR